MKLTPKEKAKELVEKFRRIFGRTNKDEMKYESKQCALISTDKEIEYLTWLNLLCTFDNPIKIDIENKIKELKEINQEILKL